MASNIVAFPRQRGTSCNHGPVFGKAASWFFLCRVAPCFQLGETARPASFTAQRSHYLALALKAPSGHRLAGERRF